MSKNFAITGVGGYVAPRHLKAIQATGNRVVAALDPKDSVGVMDSYSYDIRFFTEFERFDRHIEMLRHKNSGDRIDYVSVCSPNHLHDAHARFALRAGADAICEKPLVLNPWNCDALQDLEQEYGKHVYTVLQLRVHPALLALKEQLDAQASDEKHDVRLCYVASRGPWYQVSWKGDIERSGGVATNVGIHFFDMLIWLFGSVQDTELHVGEPTRMGGYIELERARVRWLLSVDRQDLPPHAIASGAPTHRSITVDGEELEFTGGFTDLHTLIYEDVLAGRGFPIETARPAIELAYDVRHAASIGIQSHSHPLLKSSPAGSQQLRRAA